MPYTIVRDGIAKPLAGRIGVAERGRVLLVARDAANCVLCHAVPDPAIADAGDLGPSLAGVGARFTAAQLRLRIVDILRLAPTAAMPSYYRVFGFNDVARPYRGQPILTEQEVEDVVAYLATLR